MVVKKWSRDVKTKKSKKIFRNLQIHNKCLMIVGLSEKKGRKKKEKKRESFLFFLIITIYEIHKTLRIMLLYPSLTRAEVRISIHTYIHP